MSFLGRGKKTEALEGGEILMDAVAKQPMRRRRMVAALSLIVAAALGYSYYEKHWGARRGEPAPRVAKPPARLPIVTAEGVVETPVVRRVDASGPAAEESPRGAVVQPQQTPPQAAESAVPAVSGAGVAPAIVHTDTASFSSPIAAAPAATPPAATPQPTATPQQHPNGQRPVALSEAAAVQLKPKAGGATAPVQRDVASAEIILPARRHVAAPKHAAHRSAKPSSPDTWDGGSRVF